MNCRTPFLGSKQAVADECRLVFVYDPTDGLDEIIPIGKQTINPSHIFYTPCSGIWQSVWIEAGPKNHIRWLDLQADMEGEGTSCFNHF